MIPDRGVKLDPGFLLLSPFSILDESLPSRDDRSISGPGMWDDGGDRAAMEKRDAR
jgi:hypothetical protein